MATVNKTSWTVDTSAIQSRTVQVMRGETADIAVSFVCNKETVTIPAGSTAKAYWRSSDMEPDVYYNSDDVTISGNTLTWSFGPDNDAGKDRYDWWLQLDSGDDGKSYRACGRIEILPAPGNVPGEIPIPPRVLDFAVIEVHNAPYYTMAETDTLLDGKADSTHDHAIADVLGLQGALDGKANAEHLHGIADVTGLEGALASKADTADIPTKVSELTNDAGYLTSPINTAQIANYAVTGAKIASGAVTGAKIASGTIYTGNLSTALQNEINEKLSTSTGGTMHGGVEMDVPSRFGFYYSDPYAFEGTISSSDFCILDVDTDGYYTMTFYGTLYVEVWNDETYSYELVPVDVDDTIEVSVSGAAGYGTLSAGDYTFDVTVYLSPDYPYIELFNYDLYSYITLYPPVESIDYAFGKSGSVLAESDIPSIVDEANQFAVSNVSVHNNNAQAHPAIRNSITAISDQLAAMKYQRIETTTIDTLPGQVVTLPTNGMYYITLGSTIYSPLVLKISGENGFYSVQLTYGIQWYTREIRVQPTASTSKRYLLCTLPAIPSGYANAKVTLLVFKHGFYAYCVFRGVSPGSSDYEVTPF